MTTAQSTLRKAFYGEDCIDLMKTQKITSGCVVNDNSASFKFPTADFKSNGVTWKPADATDYKTWPSYKTITIPTIFTMQGTAQELR